MLALYSARECEFSIQVRVLRLLVPIAEDMPIFRAQQFSQMLRIGASWVEADALQVVQQFAASSGRILNRWYALPLVKHVAVADKVLSSVRERIAAIRPAASLMCVAIILPVVFLPANDAYLEAAVLIQRRKPAARTRRSPLIFHDCIRALVAALMNGRFRQGAYVCPLKFTPRGVPSSLLTMSARPFWNPRTVVYSSTSSENVRLKTNWSITDESHTCSTGSAATIRDASSAARSQYACQSSLTVLDVVDQFQIPPGAPCRSGTSPRTRPSPSAIHTSPPRTAWPLTAMAANAAGRSCRRHASSPFAARYASRITDSGRDAMASHDLPFATSRCPNSGL